MERRTLTKYDQSSIELETITNNPNMVVPDCCRENREDCIHKLEKQSKREYNPI